MSSFKEMRRLNTGHHKECPCIYCPNEHGAFVKAGEQFKPYPEMGCEDFGLVTVVMVSSLLNYNYITFAREKPSGFKSCESLINSDHNILSKLDNYNSFDNYDACVEEFFLTAFYRIK